MLISEFFNYALKLLDMHPPEFACPQLCRILPMVLTDPRTSEEIEKTGRHVLYERVGGLTVLGHHHPKSVHSMPHDHGKSWAIYGVVSGTTAMYRYEKIDTETNKVRLTDSYWVMPGQAHYYKQGAIHSHKTHSDSRLLRLEGINLWRKELKPGGQRFEMVTL